jgi:tRNA (Thr-GGU) A37 N-methylase
MVADENGNMNIEPIEMIHAPYMDRRACPPQRWEEIGWTEIFDEYSEGLKGSKHGQ